MLRTVLPLFTLALAGCSGWALATRQIACRDAQSLFRILQSHELLYQNALSSELRTIEDAREWVASRAGRDPAEELQLTRRQFQELEEALGSVSIRAGVRREYLEPILRQIAREEAELGAIEDLLGRDDAAGARARLERHGQLRNLFTPAIRGIRQAYGVARPRCWRGHPLTV